MLSLCVCHRQHRVLSTVHAGNCDSKCPAEWQSSGIERSLIKHSIPTLEHLNMHNLGSVLFTSKLQFGRNATAMAVMIVKLVRCVPLLEVTVCRVHIDYALSRIRWTYDIASSRDHTNARLMHVFLTGTDRTIGQHAMRSTTMQLSQLRSFLKCLDTPPRLPTQALYGIVSRHTSMQDAADAEIICYLP